MAAFGFILFAGIVYALFLPKKAQKSTQKAAVHLVRGKYEPKRKQTQQSKQVSLSPTDALRLKEVKLAAQLKEVRAQLRNNA
ncbi:hypothetical protein [Alicyclobacillus mengziensis]|uniref:Uncharacterized protein n=1 Tax=Alicyclobacillus mengziensis TaxID=2931921 RepID=A0A9X7VYR3_9BACL|nr:hypothetical protein [Alicyclobacillus mengziensis]QSO47230.1 hypothetical protein JZ786_23020 [Alicyclobacillus mengziensis]